MKCLCGCGGELPPRVPRKTRPTASFLTGHHTRVLKRAPRNYVPMPEEIPSGLCECGCGEKTNICQSTNKQKRHFRGYPMPNKPGHSKANRATGADHSAKQWKGGRRTTPEGYAYVRTPIGHPFGLSNGYIAEHRLVMEKMLGRYLEPFEQVHHINGIKDDNRPENLELWDRSQPNGIRVKDFHCPGCRCHE